jgi:hypothetical protein
LCINERRDSEELENDLAGKKSSMRGRVSSNNLNPKENC